MATATVRTAVVGHSILDPTVKLVSFRLFWYTNGTIYIHSVLNACPPAHYPVFKGYVHLMAGVVIQLRMHQ